MAKIKTVVFNQNYVVLCRTYKRLDRRKDMLNEEKMVFSWEAVHLKVNVWQAKKAIVLWFTMLSPNALTRLADREGKGA